MHGLLGSDFNFVLSPNLSNAIIIIKCIAATVSRQIKLTPTMIIDQFAKYSIHQ